MLARLSRPGAQLGDGRMAAIFASQWESVREWLRGQSGFRLLEVEYADCLRDPEGTASRILESLEVPLDRRAMAAAVDPSLYRQRCTAK